MNGDNKIYYDEELGEFCATSVSGIEVWGATWAKCEQRLRDANRVYLDHCRHNEPPSQISDSRDSAEMLGV